MGSFEGPRASFPTTASHIPNPAPAPAGNNSSPGTPSTILAVNPQGATWNEEPLEHRGLLGCPGRDEEQIPIPAGTKEQIPIPGVLPGQAQGWDSIPGSQPELSTSLALGLPFPSSRSCFVPAFPSFTSGGCTMDAGRAGIPREGPQAAQCCVRTVFGSFLMDLFCNLDFLLKPESTMALAEGTGTFPD